LWYPLLVKLKKSSGQIKYLHIYIFYVKDFDLIEKSRLNSSIFQILNSLKKMIRNKAVSVKQTALLLCVFILTPVLVGAFNYRQPAYITSFYLCNKLVKKGNSIQPERVLNALIAGNPKEAAHIVVDIVGNQGVHNPEVEILDANGNLYTDPIKINPVTVKNDSEFFRLAPRISGKFPEGGVFFKISDKLNTGSRTTIGMFGVMTIK